MVTYSCLCFKEECKVVVGVGQNTFWPNLHEMLKYDYILCVNIMCKSIEIFDSQKTLTLYVVGIYV